MPGGANVPPAQLHSTKAGDFSTLFRKPGIIFILIAAIVFNSPPASPGQVSAASLSIVNPKQVYTYDIMVRDLQALQETYPGLIRLHVIGSSEYGRDIWAADLGHGDAYILMNASHHAREWITTILVMSMLERYALAYEQNETWNGVPVRNLLHRVTFRFVPMVNPDGVTLQQSGLAAFPQEIHDELLAMNGGSNNFKRWKANAKGIDLNRQYPADWANIRDPKSGPYYMNYKGKAPLEAKEAQAMAEVTMQTMPEISVAYHSSGEIVYWHFHTKPEHVARDRAIVSRYAGMTGYRIVEPRTNPSGGGHTDWFIQTFGRPALTPELGRRAGETNVPLSEWDRIWKQHRDTGWMLAEEAYKLWLKRQTAAAAAGEIRLTETERAHRWPDPQSAKLEQIYPGRYQLLRTKGDWAEISAPAGPRWVWAGRSPAGAFERLGGQLISLPQDAPLYGSPLDSRPAAAPDGARNAELLERWNDWLMIRTAEAVFWVKEADLSGEAADTADEAASLADREAADSAGG